MSWTTGIRDAIENKEKKAAEQQMDRWQVYNAFSPLVMKCLRELGAELYGTNFFFSKKYTVTTSPPAWRLYQKTSTIEFQPEYVEVQLCSHDEAYTFHVVNGHHLGSRTFYADTQDTSEAEIKRALL